MLVEIWKAKVGAVPSLAIHWFVSLSHVRLIP